MTQETSIPDLAAINAECGVCDDFEGHGGPCRGQAGQLRPSGQSCPLFHPAETTGPLMELFGQVESADSCPFNPNFRATEVQCEKPPAAGFPPAPPLSVRPGLPYLRQAGSCDQLPVAGPLPRPGVGIFLAAGSRAGDVPARPGAFHERK